ncbi:hypothetical protein [Amycolatopsis sp. NPDC059021]|uniref:hypothetical protein n=1 Tax=Amycolatopsis sp. NPDC059021 TaxID=3346704 RepID=UPI003670D895
MRGILGNPRYTGHEVWNKQRKQESLIDVEDVALGHETKLALKARLVVNDGGSARSHRDEPRRDPGIGRSAGRPVGCSARRRPCGQARGLPTTGSEVDLRPRKTDGYR